MNKNYYIKVYNKKWDKCLEEARKENMKNIEESANCIFEESCNAEEVVGYYLVYHGENALKDWKDNINGIKMSSQDLEVDKILTELFKNGEN